METDVLVFTISQHLVRYIVIVFVIIPAVIHSYSELNMIVLL